MVLEKDYYVRLLDELGDERIAEIDREESGYQVGGVSECEQSGGAFTFSALDRDEQADILKAIADNLPTMTCRPNFRTGTSYALKHRIENYLGRYTSNLQSKTAMRILGYIRSGDDLNPHYNVSRREWLAFSDLAGKARRAG